MKISIVIPNYNGKEILAPNLPQILRIKVDEVIVVDDASTDGSVEEIKYQISNIKNTEQKAKLKLIKNEKNLGFASSVNIGVRQATGNLILLLNSDVVPAPDFLPPLIKHFSDPKVFAVGCLQKCQEDGHVVLRGRGIGDFKRGFLVHRRGEIDKNNTLWVSGGAGMFRKKIWERLGGMNTLYNPFYWEDIDLSYRAFKAGYSLLFEPKSVVTHFQSTGSIRATYSSFYIKTIAYRNQILFVWLNIVDSFYLLQHFFSLPYHLLKAAVTFDCAFIRGFVLALTDLPQVSLHRHRNKQFKRISDNDIFKSFSVEF